MECLNYATYQMSSLSLHTTPLRQVLSQKLELTRGVCLCVSVCICVCEGMYARVHAQVRVSSPEVQKPSKPQQFPFLPHSVLGLQLCGTMSC